MLYEIIFSPTGGTSKACHRLSQAWDCEKLCIDLFRRDYERRIPTLTSEDVCIVAMPVYSGRIPAIAAQRLTLLNGCGAKAVLMAVYGSRAIDDALVELEDILTDRGFIIAAGVEAVSEHSLVRKFGEGRPNAQDAACLMDFGKRIAAKLNSGDLSTPKLPGNRPYRLAKPAGIQPQVLDGCINCGICARECPAGAIEFHAPWTADSDKCISCMHCIRFCPKGYRTVSPEKINALAQLLEPRCAGIRENKLYI